MGKSEGAKPRLKRVCGYTLPPSRFQRATSLSEGGSYAPFQEGVNMPVAFWLAAEGCRGGGSNQGVAKPRLKPVLKMKRVELHELPKISIYGGCKDLFVKQ